MGLTPENAGAIVDARAASHQPTALIRAIEGQVGAACACGLTFYAPVQDAACELQRQHARRELLMVEVDQTDHDPAPCTCSTAGRGPCHAEPTRRT